jgi:predicted ArsR family transcriptional regulator
VNRFDALADSGLRETLLFVRAQAAPVTAGDVAAALDVPRSVARWRLEKLAAASLLETAFERRTNRSGPGAGRPAKLYAPAAETSAIEFPPRRYETIVGLLSEGLPRKALTEIGAKYAQALASEMRLRPAGSIRAGLERMCRGLGRLGFQVAVGEVTADGATLVSATCPLRPLLASQPHAAAIDEGMWRGLIEAATERRARPRVRCTTNHCLERDKSCRIDVELTA